VNAKQPAGMHAYRLNAMQFSLSSGVYFYRVQADGVNGERFVQTKKMLLLK